MTESAEASGAIHTSHAVRSGSMTIPGQRHVEHFLDAMWSERGLAENTLSAYRADLVGLSR